MKNGNLFSVKHWACEHYGKQAVMIIGPQINSIPNLLNIHILELGKMSLNPSELKILTNALKRKNISLSDAPVKNYIKADNYSEYYYQVSIASEIIIIEIKLYI